MYLIIKSSLVAFQLLFYGIFQIFRLRKLLFQQII